MLSILIPVYNRDIRALVNSLSIQAKDLGVPYEIICIDDCSELYKEENREISETENCVLIELDANAGRSEIRNKLIDRAKYTHLLFLDCDMLPVHNDFLAKYWSLRDKDLVCGGRLYRREDCNSKTKLHYHYGSRREVFDFERKRFSFITGNFFIHKNVLNVVSFDTGIKGYGHEDTLFGIEVEKKGFEISYTDNPTFHIGLNNNSVFLTNTRSAVENLFSENKRIEKELQDHVRLSRFARKHPFFYSFAGRAYYLNKYWIEKILPVIPSMPLLDFYKLSYFGYLKRKNKCRDI